MGAKPNRKTLTEQAKELLALGRAEEPDEAKITELAAAYEEGLDEAELDDEDLDLTEEEIDELDALLSNVLSDPVFGGEDEDSVDELPLATALPPPPTAEEMAAAAAAKKARKRARYGSRSPR